MKKIRTISVYAYGEVIIMGNAEVPGVVRQQRLEQWITEYGDAILRTCYVYLSDAAQAEDAMQDTFLKAWNSMAQFEARNGASEKTWLMRIAINTCRDHRRSRWFRVVDRSKAIEDIPEALVSVAAEDQTLFLDIQRLPAKYKQVILLYYYHEMTLQEIAEALQLSLSTVYRRLQKAQALLKRSLTGEGY